MARTQEQGINYFPLDVNFLSDTKIKILKAKYGMDGVMIWIYLLCAIYKEGYYIKADEDFLLIAAGDLGFTEDKVEQVLTFLLKRSMFDEQVFESDAVLTSANIQERWLKAVESRAKKTPITVNDYWLLTDEKTPSFVKRTHFDNSSRKNGDNSRKNGDNSEKNTQSKVKESKSTNTITYTVAPTPPPALDDIAEYCKIKKLKVNPKRFYEYYSKLNWHTAEGKPIDDWYALLEHWDKTQIQKNATSKDGSFATDDFFEAAVKRSYGG